MKKWRPPPVCPVCGEDVPPRASACPGCGADERTGWQDDASEDGLDLPDDAFNYDDFVKTEFRQKPPRSGLHPAWLILAVVLLVAFVAVRLMPR